MARTWGRLRHRRGLYSLLFRPVQVLRICATGYYAHPNRILEVTRPARIPQAPCIRARSRRLRAATRMACLPLLLGLAPFAAAQTNTTDAPPTAAELDWVPLDQLTPEQRQGIDTNCCGRYLEPEFPTIPGPAGSVLLQGDIVTAEGSGLSEWTGNLEIQQQDAILSAESGNYDRNAGTAELNDGVRIRQPGLLFTGSNAHVDLNESTSTLNDANYVLHESGARGSASVIVYTDANGVVTIDNGVYTRCEPGDNAWQVTGDNILLNRETGRGVARGVTLEIRDVPVLYLPWVSFPINDERATGFLAPVIGNTRDGGLDFSAPYYFNLAPNYDLTLTPRIQTKRGVMLSSEFRHRGQNYQQLLDLQYLPNDRLYSPERSNQPNSDSPPVPDRWLFNYEYQGRLGPGWSAAIDYSAVSDFEYFQDLGNNGLSNTAQSYLYRNAQVRYQGTYWDLRAATTGFQIIDPTVSELRSPYHALPRINLNGSRTFGPGLELGLDNEYVYFSRDVDQGRLHPSVIDSGALVTGSRFSATPWLSLPMSTAGAFLTPTLKYKYAAWSLEDQARDTDASPTRGIATGTIDSGLIFERPIEFGGESYLQTLEPRLYYLYSEYEDQSELPVFDSSELTFGYNQLFRDDRFSGKDRIGDSNQLTLALSTRFYDNMGREKARLSAGQIRYFEDRRVTLHAPEIGDVQDNGSAFVGEFVYQLNDNWRTTSYLQWNPVHEELEVGNFQIQYQSDINRIINFGYRYRTDTEHLTLLGPQRRINQTDLSAVWPLNDNWGLIGRWNYDHANKRNLEVIAGVEYNNCCWTMRVIAREWIDNAALFYGSTQDNNTGIFLQFELKGLGSILGGNVSSILNNGISGYRERDYVQ